MYAKHRVISFCLRNNIEQVRKKMGPDISQTYMLLCGSARGANNFRIAFMRIYPFYSLSRSFSFFILFFLSFDNNTIFRLCCQLTFSFVVSPLSVFFLLLLVFRLFVSIGFLLLHATDKQITRLLNWHIGWLFNGFIVCTFFFIFILQW